MAKKKTAPKKKLKVSDLNAGKNIKGGVKIDFSK